MNITILGGGKFGYSIAEQLSAEDHDVVIIDNNEKRVERFTSSLDVMGVVGNGASHLVQREAGVAQADLFVAATGSDEVNMLSCVLAGKMGASHTIARIRKPEYNDRSLE
ncbi:MAG: NAD-binding protein, partial [Butyricicoccus sp.]